MNEDQNMLKVTSSLTSEQVAEAKGELLGMLLQQLQSTKDGFTANGKQLYYQSRQWTVPDTSALNGWIEAQWPELEGVITDLINPPFFLSEVGNVIDKAVKATQSLKASGVPGLARADVAAGLAVWLVKKFAPQKFTDSWYGKLFTEALLPVLVEAAWKSRFGN